MNHTLLFVAWDGASLQYIQGLFLPILRGLQPHGYKIKVLHASWANKHVVQRLQADLAKEGIGYVPIQIKRQFSIIGTLYSLWLMERTLKHMLQAGDITHLMPRSTLPGLITWRLRRLIKKQDIQLIFDADGLPLEERLDFAGLSPQSRQYRFLKRKEGQVIQLTDKVLTRSQKAIEHHAAILGEGIKTKCFVVSNGRDTNVFHYSESARVMIRKDLGISADTLLFIYVGSLGPQYGWEEMVQIVQATQKKQACAWLILTAQQDYALSRLSADLQAITQVMTVAPDAVPDYLSAADIAFAIRDPKPSMIGVAPIKLGEYLLLGLPTIASNGIGDTEVLLKDFDQVHLFNHKQTDRIEHVITFVQNIKLSAAERMRISQKAAPVFSLAASINAYLKALN
ncbi:glycosyltransferase [Penaeicola halotolerans]|uniref:glycosyltransferase n=1 Tax=Penaeicola halotolerans TaxID=2793196 RepID=UPI001CF8E0C2|nr:glycosyltransferase [Penaeicola halotolerans]